MKRTFALIMVAMMAVGCFAQLPSVTLKNIDGKTVDTAKLLDNFELPANTKVVACPFVSKYGKQYQEMLEKRPHLYKLMEMLESKPYYIIKQDNLYIVEE